MYLLTCVKYIWSPDSGPTAEKGLESECFPFFLMHLHQLKGRCERWLIDKPPCIYGVMVPQAGELGKASWVRANE